jgi:transcription elongation factor GreA
MRSTPHFALTEAGAIEQAALLRQREHLRAPRGDPTGVLIVSTCGVNCMVARSDARDGASMTHDTMLMPREDVRLAAAGRVILTQAEFDQLRDELEALRNAHRDDLADRLRHARGFGVMGDNDDQLAAFEDAAIDGARIVQLERLIASATVIDGAWADDGAATLGSIVRFEDSAGRRAEYELVGVRSEDATRAQVTARSPMGRALLGASAGDTVRVMLPDGRERSLSVLAVVTARPEPPPTGTNHAR